MSNPSPPSDACIFYQQGSCIRGNDCGFFHSDPDHRRNNQRNRTAFGLPVEDVQDSLKLARRMQSDMKVWDQGKIWPFSSYMALEKPKAFLPEKNSILQVNFATVEAAHQGPPGQNGIETAHGSQAMSASETLQSSQELMVAEAPQGQPKQEVDEIIELPPCGTIPRVMCFSDLSPEEVQCDLVMSKGNPYSISLIRLVNRYDCIRRKRFMFAGKQGACQNEVIASLQRINKKQDAEYYTAFGLKTHLDVFTNGEPYPDRLKRMMTDLAAFDPWFGHMKAQLEARLDPLNPDNLPAPGPNTVDAENGENVEPNEGANTEKQAHPSSEQSVTPGKRILGVHTASNIPSMQRENLKGASGSSGTNQLGFNKKFPSNVPGPNRKSGIPVPVNSNRQRPSRLPVDTAHDCRPANINTCQPHASARNENCSVIPSPTVPFRNQPKSKEAEVVLVVRDPPEFDYLFSDVEMEDLSNSNSPMPLNEENRFSDGSSRTSLLVSEEVDAPVEVARSDTSLAIVESSNSGQAHIEDEVGLESMQISVEVPIVEAEESFEALETLRSELENLVVEAENSMDFLDRDASGLIVIDWNEVDIEIPVEIEFPQTPVIFLIADEAPPIEIIKAAETQVGAENEVESKSAQITGQVFLVETDERFEAIETLRSELEKAVEETENKEGPVPVQMPLKPPEFSSVETDESYEVDGSRMESMEPIESLRSEYEDIAGVAENSMECLDKEMESSVFFDWKQELEYYHEAAGVSAPLPTKQRKVVHRKCSIV